MNKLKFGIKLFASYIIFALILILSIALVHLYFSKEQQMQQFTKEAKLQGAEKREKFDEHIKVKKDALLAVVRNEQFLDFVANSKKSYFVDLLFLTLMDANKDYMQMRYINKDGLEILRFERDKESQIAVKTESLQDKAQRNYFREVSKMAHDEVYISNIDLNIEHGKIEVPHKSVIRFATPIYCDKKFMGILIINVFMDSFLQNLISSTLYDISLINKEGYFIKHYNKELEWTKVDMKEETKDKKHFFVPLLFSGHKINMLLVENETSLQKIKNYNNKMIGVILFLQPLWRLFLPHSLQKYLKIYLI